MALNRHSGPEGGLLQKGGGYFQVPDLVFDLDLTANEKLVLIYFMRRADRQGRSFPSVERICRDCGFGSRNTVYKAMKTLISAGLIRREPVPGRSHNCFVSQKLYKIIESAKERNAGRKNGSGGPHSHLTNSADFVEETSATCSPDEQGCSRAEQPGVQNMNTKEYTVEGSSNKEDTVSLKEDARENAKRVHEEACASSSSDPRLDDDEVTMLDVVNHMDALSPAERRRFDAEALRLREPGEPDPRENLWQKRILRMRHLRRLRG